MTDSIYRIRQCKRRCATERHADFGRLLTIVADLLSFECCYCGNHTGVAQCEDVIILCYGGRGGDVACRGRSAKGRCAHRPHARTIVLNKFQALLNLRVGGKHWARLVVPT